MTSMINILGNEHVFPFALTTLAFFVLIFLVRAQKLHFLGALIFLVIALLVGLFIDHAHDLKRYFYEGRAFALDVPKSSTAMLVASSKSSSESDASDVFLNGNFQAQILRAIENLKEEVVAEKENLSNVMHQIEELFASVDTQKHKLQNFIDESRERFKTDIGTQSKFDIQEHEGK